MHVLISEKYPFSTNSFVIFILLYLFSLFPIVLDGLFQYIAEFIFILIFSPFVFRRHPRSFIYLLAIYVYSRFPYL